MSMIDFKLNFVCGIRIEILFVSNEYLVLPASFVEKTTLSALN